LDREAPPEEPKMAKERILVIEDEADIGELIQYNLAREGYWVSVIVDGEEGFDRVLSESPDLVILDLMLPGTDGLELCRRFKEDPVTRPIPIIMVTAKSEEADVIVGLGVGADDYVPKPFSPRELVARVRAVLRRGKLRPDVSGRDRIVRNGLTVDAVRHQVTVDGRDVPFTATEFRLLHVLASHPGRAFTREQLLSRVIGEAAAVTDRNIDVHVRTIRKKLGNLRNHIETVRGVGYRFLDER
jgi:two-component system phosphate regulon response regulator PhoB